MTLYNRIQQLILLCIDKKLSVRAFREQFVPLFSSINRRFDLDAAVLADKVDNLYADVLVGDLTEDDFRRKLVQLTPVVTDEVSTKWQRFEWAFGTTTSAPELAGTGPKPVDSTTDGQVLEYEYA